ELRRRVVRSAGEVPLHGLGSARVHDRGGGGREWGPVGRVVVQQKTHRFTPSSARQSQNPGARQSHYPPALQPHHPPALQAHHPGANPIASATSSYDRTRASWLQVTVTIRISSAW